MLITITTIISFAPSRSITTTGDFFFGRFQICIQQITKTPLPPLYLPPFLFYFALKSDGSQFFFVVWKGCIAATIESKSNPLQSPFAGFISIVTIIITTLVRRSRSFPSFCLPGALPADALPSSFQEVVSFAQGRSLFFAFPFLIGARRRKRQRQHHHHQHLFFNLMLATRRDCKTGNNLLLGRRIRRE